MKAAMRCKPDLLEEGRNAEKTDEFIIICDQRPLKQLGSSSGLPEAERQIAHTPKRHANWRATLVCLHR